MPSFTTRIIKNKFVTSVAVVATGTASAQAVSVIFSPIITRLYNPDAIGLLGTYLAIIAVMAPLSALTYPSAIVIAKTTDEARAITKLSHIISIIVSMIFLLSTSIFGEIVSVRLGVPDFHTYLYLIPIAILLTSSLQIKQQWILRQQDFKILANSSFIHSLILNIGKAIAGIFYATPGPLILFATLSPALNLLIIRKISPKNRNHLQLESTRLKNVARQHIDFPIYRAPQIAINSLSQNLPILMLTFYYGATQAGYYVIAKTMLAAPVTLISKSVGDVFYPKISKKIRDREHILRPLIKATTALAAIALIPFTTIILFGPQIFSLIFGENWQNSGVYAQWISLWIFFGFINRPCVATIPALKLQRWLFFYEIASSSSKAIALYCGFVFLEDSLIGVALMSVSGAIFYIYLILYVLFESKKWENSNEQ